MKNTYVVDFGNNAATIYDGDNDITKAISLEDVLRLPETLPAGSKVISEDSHLGAPRTKKSKSQAFEAEVLLDLYDRFEQNNIELRLFPQKQTPNACSFSKLPKSNMTDPKSVYLWIKSHPKLTLKKPLFSFSDPKRNASYEYKDNTTIYCNYARQTKTPYAEDECSKWIIANIEEIASRLDEETKYWFSLDEDARYSSTRGPKAKRGKFNFNSVKMNGLFAVISTLLDIDGKLRIRPETGQPPGWEYIKKYVIQMSPHHERGGTARSNLYYHIFKKSKLYQRGKLAGFDYKRKVRKIGTKEKVTIQRGNFNQKEDAFFLQERKKFSDSIRKLWQVCKVLLNSDPNIQKQDSSSFSEESEIISLSCTN